MLNDFNFDFDGDKKKKKKEKNNFNNIMNLNNSENNNSPNNDSQNNNFCSLICEKLKIWFDSLTFIVKLIVSISIILWVLDFITIDYFSYILANIPYYTIGYFQIWRLITGNLMTTGFLNLLFAIIFWFSDGIIIEKQEGTAKYFLYFLIHSTIIQIIYDILYLFLVGISQKPNRIYSSGLWSYIICEITINCLVSPDNKIYLLCIPYAIKAKFFPILLLFIFFIFGSFELVIFIAVGYGFLYGLFLKKYLILSDNIINKVENTIFSGVLNWRGFIKMSEKNNNSKQQPFIGNFMQNNQNDSDSFSDDSDSNNFQNKLKKFTPFTGRGITLGTDKGYK